MRLGGFVRYGCVGFVRYGFAGFVRYREVGFLLLLVADVGEFPVEFFDGDDVFWFGGFDAHVGFVWHFVVFGLNAQRRPEWPAVRAGL